MRKKVTNLERFGVSNVDREKEPVLILFGDNKASVQLKKSIFNTKKIKYINTAFHKVKNKSKKDTIFL